MWFNRESPPDRQRKSNIELLRIVSMLMIIGTHYINSSDAFDLVSKGVAYETLLAIQTLCIYGVNLFGLITGYFMIDCFAISLRKIINLLVDVSLYGIILYVISIFVGVNTFSLTGIAKSLLPILAGYRWFIKAYVILYVLIPFINKAISNLAQKQYCVLIASMGIFFSLWPSLLPYPPLDDYGYGFIHLIFLFVIGGYLRKYGKEFKLKKCIIVSGLCYALIIRFCNFDTSIPILDTFVAYKWAYNNPLNIIAAICIFKAFLRIDFSSRMVNTMAASAFSVYLIHGDFNMMNYIFNEILHANMHYSYITWVVHFLIGVVLIYAVCFVIDLIKKSLLNRTINHFLDKIRCFNLVIDASN